LQETNSKVTTSSSETETKTKTFWPDFWSEIGLTLANGTATLRDNSNYSPLNVFPSPLNTYVIFASSHSSYNQQLTFAAKIHNKKLKLKLNQISCCEMDKHSSLEDAANKDNETSSNITNNTSLGNASGTALRRQPTKYPHGLNITVQTVDEASEDYSRASTLRSNSSNESCWTDTQKYRIGMLGSPETLAELQVSEICGITLQV